MPCSRLAMQRAAPPRQSATCASAAAHICFFITSIASSLGLGTKDKLQSCPQTRNCSLEQHVRATLTTMCHKRVLKAPHFSCNGSVGVSPAALQLEWPSEHTWRLSYLPAHYSTECTHRFKQAQPTRSQAHSRQQAHQQHRRSEGLRAASELGSQPSHASCLRFRQCAWHRTPSFPPSARDTRGSLSGGCGRTLSPSSAPPGGAVHVGDPLPCGR